MFSMLWPAFLVELVACRNIAFEFQGPEHQQPLLTGSHWHKDVLPTRWDHVAGLPTCWPSAPHRISLAVFHDEILSMMIATSHCAHLLDWMPAMTVSKSSPSAFISTSSPNTDACMGRKYSATRQKTWTLTSPRDRKSRRQCSSLVLYLLQQSIVSAQHLPHRHKSNSRRSKHVPEKSRALQAQCGS